MSENPFGGPPPGASVLEYYSRPTPTYASANARLASGSCACVVDPVPGGCSYASSERNQQAIKTFTTSAEATDDLQIFVYLAGHSGMINTHQVQGEPKIFVGCNTFFFNNAGESTFLLDSANVTSTNFMRRLGELSTRHNTITKGQFYSFLERFRNDHLIRGSPISLYPLQDQIDDLIVLGAGTLHHSEYNPGGGLNGNPASVRIFVKRDKGGSFLGDLISPNLIDMWQVTRGNLQIAPSMQCPGYLEIKINPYMYFDPSSVSGLFRPVRLSDIYSFIREAVTRMYGITGKHIMDEFMSRHVVLVSAGCRSLGSGDVCHVESVPRPLSESSGLDDDARSIGFGGKKKRRHCRTRKHKHKRKILKKKSTKRAK